MRLTYDLSDEPDLWELEVVGKLDESEAKLHLLINVEAAPVCLYVLHFLLGLGGIHFISNFK